jgi:hypothetical protein
LGIIGNSKVSEFQVGFSNLGILEFPMEVTDGEGGIRTHGGVTPTPVFETGLFNRSSTSPQGKRTAN